ncbi:hypothetical protein jhhlp_004342 [Lomentospora prolificans]|uniref:PUM-HD domain-containing protein n=1 Tax=Lomentospora prolificans TaxID=41688 RepID=A0A2N3NBD2_9PEZI|nr:hypothetical protein jhhlp_004342 [Lomentospora prolificans]
MTADQKAPASSPGGSGPMSQAPEKTTKRPFQAALNTQDTGHMKANDTRAAAHMNARVPGQGGVKIKNNQENIPFLESHSSIDLLMAKLDEQRETLAQQHDTVKSKMFKDSDKVFVPTSSSTSVPVTPAIEGLPSIAPINRPASAVQSAGDSDEVLKLKLQLAEAEAKISVLQKRPSLPLLSGMAAEQSLVQRPFGLMSTTSGQDQMGSWNQIQARTEAPNQLNGMISLQRNRTGSGATWSNNLMPPPQGVTNPVLAGPDTSAIPGWVQATGLSQPMADPVVQSYGLMDQLRGPERLTPDPDLTLRPTVSRRGGRFGNRNFTAGPFILPAGSFNDELGPHGLSLGQLGSPGPMISSPGAIGTGLFSPGFQAQQGPSSLSPHAMEFTSSGNWKNEAGSNEGTTYLPPSEPLNYRRLLDKNVNCNWQYIVDKIVCSNDQQASIFLQQKLKVGTAEQKFAIIDAIASQAYPLIVNRFGNFLIQRCFEHGTPEQVAKIAEAIRGNTVKLSMDPFGCHVVQKAFDAVSEDYKTHMVHELLQRIPETVIHRYACHVWQKLFELRWADTPPQIMMYVNEALRGMWHEVALGETGSLVVQNIFENCREEDKRPCIEEVLAHIDIVAHGQFGNWCIQHICEHGAPADRSRAVDHVIRYAMEYSLDQFASKVVEKCLKVGGSPFCQRYLDQITKRDDDRPRLPIIDISADQYGNYLIQWIINNAQDPAHVEIVVAHIRKHMVSLRGSKFGSRVGMLCTNPASATRPGPGVGPGMGGGRHGPRYGGNPNYR